MIETSIIIRTKNEERWINSCFSIFSQSYKEFEIIVVDNNSTDKTIQKLKILKFLKLLKLKTISWTCLK